MAPVSTHLAQVVDRWATQPSTSQPINKTAVIIAVSIFGFLFIVLSLSYLGKQGYLSCGSRRSKSSSRAARLVHLDRGAGRGHRGGFSLGDTFEMRAPQRAYRPGSR